MSNYKVKSKVVTSAAEIGQLQFNEMAYAQRNATVGGCFEILGAINAATRVGMFAALMIANTDTNGHYVKFGADGTVAAPTGIANGFYIPPQSVVYLSSGNLSYIRADSALVGCYKMYDNIAVQELS